MGGIAIGGSSASAPQFSPGPAAAAVGHGQLGLSSGLPIFADIVAADSGVSRRPYLELRLGRFLTGWTASGLNYKTTLSAADLTYAGVIRPIVAAESLIAPRALVRVERVADMVAGTWFFDDGALAAGTPSDLYVRLPTATDPDATTAGLMIQLLFCYGGGDPRGNAEVHPLLGANKYVNAGFEAWAGGNPTGWTEYGAGATQETGAVLDGLSSALIGSSAIASAALDGTGQASVGVSGAFYRVSGYYKTPHIGQSPDVEARLRVGDGTNFVMSDGMSLTSTDDGGVRLADTHGETRRFIFDFVWSGATTTALQADVLLYNGGAAPQAGFLYADRLAFRRIWRWNVYEPKLSASAIPELTIQSQSILFGPKTLGFGSVTILDGDGELAKVFASLVSHQKPAQVYVGGSFRNGEEIHRDDWRGVFPAIIRKPTISPGLIELELENALALAKADAAERSHRRAEQTTMSRSQEGEPKPLVFGTPWDDGGITFQHIIPGIGVATNATTGYKEYEYLDPYIPVRDGVDVDLPASYSIKAFPTEDLANRNLQGYVITDSTNDFDVTNNKTRWRVKRDIRNYQYDRAGKDVGTGSVFSFGIGSFEVVAGVNNKIDVAGPGGVGATSVTLTAGKYTGATLAAHVETLLDALGGFGDFTVTYSLTTGKFTITYNGGGNIEFQTQNGLNAATNAMRLLMGFTKAKVTVGGVSVDGYSQTTDYTGATNYTSFEPVFGVTVYTASLDVLGPAYKVAADLKAAMRAAAGGITTIDVTYSETTHKFTITYSGTHLIFVLIMANPVKAYIDGARVPEAPQKQSYTLIGFDTKTDKTGALTYTSDVATFTDAEVDHIIRFPGGGYRDDATGSIAGVANAAIDSWPAIASWLIQKRLGRPASEVNVEEVAAAREISRTLDFAIVFGTFDYGDVERLLGLSERSGVLNFVPDGEGVWRCIKHAAGTAGAREFFDEDYIAGSWRMWTDPLAIFKAVKILADWNPSLRKFMKYGDGVGVLDPYLALKYGEERILEIESYIERQYIVSGASQIANYYARLIGLLPRVVSFEARSKLVDQLPGYKVILNRTGPGVLDPLGYLDGVAFRIVDLGHRYATTGISRCVAVEDVTFLT